MNGNFNGQILSEKLVKLNCSQQSIETLSHWCIFHRKNAKQVVETWAKQFHCSPKDQWVSFLYLANDILQNSRWKGPEYVGEFLKVLPDALRYVLDNGDKSGRNAALRLIDIWEDRKVFGSRGQMLKEEVLGRKQESHTSGKGFSHAFKGPIASVVERLVLGFESVSTVHIDEDTLLSKYQAALTYLKEVHREGESDQLVVGEVKEKEVMVRDCLQQLKGIKSARETLILHLKEALSEQEQKLEQLQKRLVVAEAEPQVVANISDQLKGTTNGQFLLGRHQKEAASKPNATASLTLASGAGNKDTNPSPGVSYTQEEMFSVPPNSGNDEQKKAAAAEVAAKLAASTCSSKKLSRTLSPLEPKIDQLASDGKRLKVENDLPHTPPHSQQPEQPPPPPLPYDPVPPLSLPMNPHPSLSAQMPLLQPLQPALQPPLPHQFMQMSAAYNYLCTPQWSPSVPPYPMVTPRPFAFPIPPPNLFQNAQPPEIGRSLTQPSLPATPPPISRQ